MKRRTFIHSAALSAAALPLFGSAHTHPDEAREFYEWREYTLRWGNRQSALDSYFREAFIPALKRHGVTRVGAFTEMGMAEPAKLYLLIAYPTLQHFAELPEKLIDDAAYQTASEKYHTLGPDQQVYFRFDTSLLHAFRSIPQMKVPDRKERIFELRTYESFSEDAARRKVAMFDDGEMDIFNKTGLQPVFFGSVMAGRQMPALTYMITFKDLEERAQNWKKFIDHPDWKKMSKDPAYANTVSKIHRTFLLPTSYSEV